MPGISKETNVRYSRNGIIFLVTLLSWQAWALNVNFPAVSFTDGTVLSVTQFGANGNDYCSNSQDSSCVDTQKFRNAIAAVADGANEGRILYVPNGTYYIDNTIGWKNDTAWERGITLMGQSRSGVIIKLRSNSAGFNDATHPKAMFRTSDRSPLPRAHSAFYNYIQNMTLVVSPGNAGAVGIDFHGNNNAGVMDVTIQSEDGSGFAGLGIIAPQSGPDLFKNIQINGFQYGIILNALIDNSESVCYSLTCWLGHTFEHITLSGQSTAGIKNYRDFIFIRDLVSVNSVPAIDNSDEYGFLALTDGNLTGTSGAEGKSAMINASHFMIRNISTSGYARAITDRGVELPEKSFFEYSSHSPLTLNGGKRTSLNLPVQETPEYFDSSMEHWQDVPAPKDGSGNGDDADNIQAAFDSALAHNLTTVWFRRGIYKTSRTIRITGNIKHIQGTGTAIDCLGQTCYDSTPWPILDFASTVSDLRIDYLHLGVSGRPAAPNMIGIRQTSSKTLTLVKAGFFQSATPYEASSGAGNLFLEDIGQVAGWRFSPGQNVWARQFDLEGEVSGFVNNGANLWVLGLKTESHVIVGETKGKGKTEIFGGVLKATSVGGCGPSSTPAFTNDESDVSLSVVDNPDGACSRYNVLVKETKNGATKELNPPTELLRSPAPEGSVLPLYVGSESKILSNILRPLLLSN